MVWASGLVWSAGRRRDANVVEARYVHHRLRVQKHRPSDLRVHAIDLSLSPNGERVISLSLRTKGYHSLPRSRERGEKKQEAVKSVASCF